MNVRHTGHTSTDAQDLTAQRDALRALGVSAERIYVDHGLTGAHRDRPGLREALAACRAGDTLVVSKLDRLARSLPDARDIADELTRREVRLNLGGSVHDPTDPASESGLVAELALSEGGGSEATPRSRVAGFRASSRRPRGE